ncbi:MAG TPA: sodium-translocating pyrophosphatase [Candidatus Thermoplasmatota archaeon]|nr:sodium-translocating pyrophosphatase [Candidatus Thermoplasmatota archaeon]
MVSPVILASAGAGIVALCASALLAYLVMRESPGNERMQDISRAVREGAMAFMRQEYTVVAVVAALLTAVFVVIGVATGDVFWYVTAGGFVFGAILSALAGFLGMAVSVRANARVAEKARAGLGPALALSFRAGAVNGFSVVGLGLLGITILYSILTGPLGFAVCSVGLYLIGFAFGASLITLFARIAGGIYTKAADVGADLVGKIEAGIPEDDPRNPAVIADNVGDNVGDCAGMGADLFETYVVTIIATMAVAGTATVYAGTAGLGETGILFPLALAAFAVVASIVGLVFVRLPRSGNIMGALYAGMIATVLAGAVGFYGVTVWLGVDIRFYYASLVGLGLTLGLVFITDYYTAKGYKPVLSIANASTTGPATNIIQGLAVGLESVALPAVLVVAGLIVSFLLGDAVGAGLGLYGIAIAAVGMLSVAGFVVALDTYGPITDNGGGIAEMSDLPKDVRKVTDALDAVGNTTKATTKGYAIGSAALAALVLFADYVDHASEAAGRKLVFELADPFVLSGLLLGAAVVFLFAAYAMRAVGRAAFSVVNEVRRQFRERPNIMKYKDEPTEANRPDYATCVQIVTKAALKEMVVPGALAVVTPLAVGFILGPLALGGFLIGIIVAGLALALLMANGGGAWDNAKKAIEDGLHGGKGKDAHKAAVVGDTVGDPFKDTAGPAINPLIKAINTISVIFAALIVSGSLLGGL